jgi:hypothetical protein
VEDVVNDRDEMIELKNINPGVGNTRMARRKYEFWRAAVLEAVPRTVEGIAFSELSERVAKLVPPERLAGMGAVNWHVTSVKLDLEARGLIERIPGTKPQRLRRLQ